jgi:hypothetical protein
MMIKKRNPFGRASGLSAMRFDWHMKRLPPKKSNGFLCQRLYEISYCFPRKKKCMRLYYFMMQPLLGVIECHRFPTHAFVFYSIPINEKHTTNTFTTFTNIQKNRLMIYGVWYNVFLPFSFYLFLRGRGLWGERWLKFSCICNSDAHILLSALDSLRKQDICVSKALLYFLLAYSIFRLLRTTACQ